MKQQAQTIYDREQMQWPSGPWDGEPDKVNWVDPATDLDCMLVRNRFGAWCGYVGVPPEHPAFMKHYDDISVQVHGGLTFTDSCQEGGHICHIPEEGRTDNVWWLGFDCAHAGDASPGDFTPQMLKIKAKVARSMGGHYKDGDIYRNIRFARRQVRKLAKQLKEMAMT